MGPAPGDASGAASPGAPVLFVDDLVVGVRFLGVALKVPRQTFAFRLEEFAVPFVGRDHGHDLAGAGPDRRQPHIAEDAFDGEDIGISDPAHDLHGVVDRLLARFGDELFRFRDHPAHPVHLDACVHGPGRDIGHGAGGVEQHDRFSDLETHPLELGDGLPEGLPARRIVRGDVQGRPGRPDGHGRRAESLGDHHRVEDGIGAVDLADDVFFGDLRILEDQAGCAAAAAAHESVEILGLDAGAAVNDQGGQGVLGFGGGIKIGPRIEQEIIGPLAAHDEAFLAVHEKMIPPVLGPSRGAEEIGAAARFRQAFGGEEFPPQEGFDVFFLLGVRAVADDGVADQLGTDAEDAGKFVAEGADLLHEHASGYPVHFPAAPFFRVAASQQIPPARLLEKFLGKLDGVRVHIEDHLPGHPFYEFPGLVPDL